MTKAQLYGRYFPAWSKVVHAHAWRMANCRLVGQRLPSFGSGEVDQLYQRVWQHAESTARRQCRAVIPDDLRHGIHVAALCRDQSAKTLGNQDLDRVLAVMTLLVTPEDLDALCVLDNPQISQKRRRIWWLKNKVNPAYMWKVARDMYGASDLEILNPDQIERLYAVLRHRRGALVHPGTGDPF